MTNSLRNLFEDTLKDLYNAEKQFLKAMPKLAKAATEPTLKSAIEEHITQSENHLKRLEQIADQLEIKPTGKVCKAAQGLVEEAMEHLEEVESGPVLDAAIILCAQKNEHYEICSYGTLISWANQLGLSEVTTLLADTLDEEEDTNDELTDVAESSVNGSAQGDGEGETKAKAPRRAKRSTAPKVSVK